MKFYLVYRNDGLYDPVLDDYEPIFEPIDQEDFDQPSKPTEVDPFAIQQFLDGKYPSLPELRDIETPAFTDYAELQSRSLTASPFVLPTKPYRPFSTEPIPQIPPLEDPIILNPNYKDQFGNFDDEEPLPETRFKLPISEQYDPDGTKRKSKICTKTNKETSFAEYNISKDVTFEERVKKETKISQEMQHKQMVDEVNFMKKMKKEIDLDRIEMTAMSLVDENIERAVSVADEIKREIDFELSDTEVSSDVKELVVVKETKSQKETKEANVSSQKSLKDTSELLEIIDQTTDKIISYNGTKSEVNVAKEVEKFEANKSKEQKISVDERKSFTKQELEESIVSGSVRRKSEIFDKKIDIKHIEKERHVEKNNTSEKQIPNKVTVEKCESVDTNKSKAEIESAQKAREVKKETLKTSSSKSDSQNAMHRAYTIGLQTIPNIKGSIHSSYHYNLLLKTFFIHLTDVMVALSRFILTEPVFNKEIDQVEKDVTSATTSEYISVRNEENLSEKMLVNKTQEGYEEVAKVQEEHEKKETVETKHEGNKVAVEEEDIRTEVLKEKEEIKVIEYGKDEDDKKYLEVDRASETRMLSGSKMAQLTERKSEELTLKMDAVISEFETKAGIEAETRERRCRSRSRIEEEVAKESDPLEWLSKLDKQSQELTEFKTESKSISTTSESLKKTAEIIEKQETKSSKSKKGKQMYVAIVESHVYTNKDAIFDEQITEFSETSSIQSADEINVASQVSETIATEKVALESREMKQEIAEILMEEFRDFASRNEAVKINENIESITEVDVEKAIEVDTESTALEILKQEVIEPVVEIQEVQMEEISEHIKNKKEEHITELIAIEESRHEVIQEEQKEEQTDVVIEETSLCAPPKPIEEEFKKVEIEKQVDVEIEEKIKLPAKPHYTKDESSAELKIIKEQVLEVEQTLKLCEESELLINKYTMEIENESALCQKSTMESFESNEIVQESSFTAKTADKSKKLTLQMDLAEQRAILQSQSSETSEPPSTIDTPTPSTVPPTPLTDEYVFKLQIPLPKNIGTPVPRDCTPDDSDDEDPHIVKKKLVPHIDTTIESPIIYDPPLPTPPIDKVQSPVYTKPGLKGGAERRTIRKGAVAKKEEILEIGRKSSLLASAIDETIKSIEEYKEEVGIDTKKEMKFEENTKTETKVIKTVEEQKTCKQEIIIENQRTTYDDHAKVESTANNDIENRDSKIDDEWNHIDKQVKDTSEKLSEISLKMNGEVSDKEAEIKSESQKEAISSSEIPTVEESKNVIEVEHTAETQINGGEIQKSSNLLASIDMKPASEVENTIVIETPSPMFNVEEKKDPLEGYKPIQFNPEELIETKRNLQSVHLSVEVPISRATSPSYVSETGELLGTHQGIVDGLEEAIVDAEVAKELGKPGMTEEKIAELISGEAEMLREAHVMGLSRVLQSHMHRVDDDSSVDFKKIKPIIESLKDSEVLKALNEEVIRAEEEKKKEEQKKWTTFLQTPKRPVPRAKFGYHGYIEPEPIVEEPYKVKIVKQPKPKVAPDYKPEDFETGPLPWEERSLREPTPPPLDPEEPILVPEEVPEFLEAVDPLPESEVPDLEETGIPLPPPNTEEEEKPSSPAPEVEKLDESEEQPEILDIEAVVEETEKIVEEMETNRLAEQLLSGVKSMIDPSASVEQQLTLMRAQLAALAQLPGVIQQTLELVTRQITQLTHQESQQVNGVQSYEEAVRESQKSIEDSISTTEVRMNGFTEDQEESNEEQREVKEETIMNVSTAGEETKSSLTEEERQKLKKEEEEMLTEQRRIEKQKKEYMEQMRLEQESRQVKQRPTPRVGKPKPVFGPPVPIERPLVLPGGRRWRRPEDAYNEQLIAEILTSQSEIIQGKAKGINFMKYEKPPVSLDHLQHSEVYKLIHNMEQSPVKRVEMRTPVIAEADYREKCRSVTPALGIDNHISMPQQVRP